VRAITFQGVEQLRLEDVEPPEIRRPRDVVVRVEAAGICGSDLHVYHGRETGLDHGTIMGHEFVGEIVAVGPEVGNWRPGDRVVSPFTTNCGRCAACARGLTSRCSQGQLFGWVENGQGLDGVQAEFARVPLADSTLERLPEGLAPELALFAGDILATGYFGAESAGAGPAIRLAVVGCGPVGLMAILAALDLGSREVVAIDRVPERLALAQRFGAVAVDIESVGAFDHFDAVIEAVGSPQATRLAFDLVRPGGSIAAVGVHTEETLAFSPGEAYDKNLTYRAGRCPVRRYMELTLPLAARKAAELAALISHRLPLSEGVRGYDIFARRLEGCTKVVLFPA
jgi:2-desacetyl-2-hydroxyethyl bacteriochlorophyllide A dehydrogenase